MIDFIVYLVSGKLLLWLTKKFPPIKLFMSSRELLRELFDCDICFGFWIYLILGLFFNINVDQIKNRLVKTVVLAGTSTFIAHLISLGWKEQFGEYVIENAYYERQSS